MLMTLENAQLRVMQSKMLLDHWVMLGSDQSPEATLEIIAAEIRTLADIIDEHDNMGERLAVLISEWVMFRARTKNRLH